MSTKRYSFIADIREDALWSLYLQMRSDGDFCGLWNLTAEIVDMPMPLHYISYRMARQLFSWKFERHGWGGVTRKWPQKRRLYDSFISCCERAMKDFPDECDTREIIRIALLSPAPCIGLSHSQIQRILKRRGAH